MIHFRSLASGSSGNAYLLRTSNTTLLVDAGIPVSRLDKILRSEGVEPERLTGVLISHEHRDHCSAAADLARLYGTPLWANEAVLRSAGLSGLPSAAVIEAGRSVLLGDVEVQTFPVPHDAVQPVGFLLTTQGRRIVVATDLGKPTPDVSEAVEQADLVVIEANHDPEMLANGRYPPHLRRRVAGPTGHLANYQAAEILVKHVKDDGVDVWLAHLSRNNNTQAMAVKTVTGMLRAVGLGALRVHVAQRDRPSLTWTGVPPARQLALFPSDAGVTSW